MSNIIPFPTKRTAAKGSLTIPLYGDDEVRMTIAAINMYGQAVTGLQYFQVATQHNLKTFKPAFVIDCLTMAYDSNLFSSHGKRLIAKILANVSEEQDAAL